MKAPAIALTFGVALLALTASAHTIVKTPAPIGTQADLLVSPCGCDFVNTPNKCPATYPVTPLVAGSQTMITWTELINHGGKFRVAISPLAPDAVTETDFDSHVLYEGVDNNTTVPKDLSQTILVPDAPCTKCTLQVRQAATDGPNPFYYSCAAITITPGTGGSGSTSTAASDASATVGTGVTTGGVIAPSGDGAAPPNYMPEPNATGCAIHPGDASSSDDGLTLAWLVPALGLIGHRIRRERIRNRAAIASAARRKR